MATKSVYAINYKSKLFERGGGGCCSVTWCGISNCFLKGFFQLRCTNQLEVIYLLGIFLGDSHHIVGLKKMFLFCFLPNITIVALILCKILVLFKPKCSTLNLVLMKFRRCGH